MSGYGSATEMDKVNFRTKEIIAAQAEKPLLEALRALQREEGCLTEASLKALAASRFISRTRLFGIASSYPEFSFEEAAESIRPASPPVPLPEFLEQAAAATGVVEGGPLSARFGEPPVDLAGYRAAGGTVALKRAVMEMTPEQVLSEVVLGGLTGKASAWQQVQRSEGERVIVASAHAGDPAAAQARVLLEKDPYAVLEGMFIAAIATGATRGFLFTDLSGASLAGRLEEAAEEIQRSANINFAVEAIAGPESLVGSEDSVAVACIERDRPMPFAVDVARRGVWARPTLVDRAECFASITATLATGSQVLSRIYQVSGAVKRPGLYEAEPGLEIAELLERAGASANSSLLVGGLSGSFQSGGNRDRLLGSFARDDSPRWRTLHVFPGEDARFDLLAAAASMAAYNARYLCGFCIPCRIGAVRIAEIMSAAPEDPVSLDRATLRELAWAVERSGLCAPGRGAAGMVLSAI
ncbi:MAG: SLBB domain-containing protein [Thermoleophilia bacterium]|nr:SLBB domain-containing protein [Thermoleophilia bacterium]